MESDSLSAICLHNTLLKENLSPAWTLAHYYMGIQLLTQPELIVICANCQTLFSGLLTTLIKCVFN